MAAKRSAVSASAASASSTSGSRAIHGVLPRRRQVPGGLGRSSNAHAQKRRGGACIFVAGCAICARLGQRVRQVPKGRRRHYRVQQGGHGFAQRSGCLLLTHRLLRRNCRLA